MPRYTGLKDFARGIQKLYKEYGNIPVFIEVADDKVAPFGMAIRMSSLMDCEALVLKGGFPGKPESFEPGECTD